MQEACEYRLNNLLAMSPDFGTPNTVQIPPLLKVTKHCLTEQNSRVPVQELLKSTAVKENSEQVPLTSTGKRKWKHLYRSKETISSLLQKNTRFSISVVPTLNKISMIKRLDFTNKHKTTRQAKSTPTTVKARKENIGNREKAHKKIQEQLKSAIEECSILLDCPPACILPALKKFSRRYHCVSLQLTFGC